MKKIFVLGVVLGAILALGGLAFTFYSATTASAADTPSQTFAFGSGFGTWGGNMTFQGRGPGGPGFGPLDGQNPLSPYVEAAVADILGISVEDLQAAREDGTRMSDLLDAAGLTIDEFQNALEAAIPDIVEQALADEAITQEQADFILENGLRLFHWRGGPGGFGFGLDGDGVLQPYVEAAVADILGISVEDLQAAKEAGTRMPELLENAGLTAGEFQTAMEEAVPGIVEQALADGVITQAQADYILENGLRGARGYLHSALQEYVDAAVADILGVSVEELQAAREDGTVADLLDAAGLTADEFRTALDEATAGIVEQALADGVLTQEQADFILENGLRGFGGFGPSDCMGGPGGRGPHGGGPGGFGPGGFGPGGFGPGNQNAPATEPSSGNG